jgi:L-2-hydroxyglutarate oxidase LhgO
MVDVDVTVVGGGAVGCSVAAAAARRGLSTVLLEQAGRLATGMTARNSEVAHGGMYYPPGSLKARLCVQGRRLLKEFCRRAGVPYQECGKLIVAVAPEEEDQLARLAERGQANDVEDLRLIGRQEIADLEPDVRATAALLSPRTAIVAAEGFTRAQARLAAQQGAQILTDAPVTELRRDDIAGGAWEVTVGDAGRPGWRHRSRWVVNCAGLQADGLAAMAGLDLAAEGLDIHWVKGSYFRVAPRHAGRLHHLVYPVPPADGWSLGVHVCLDLAGQLRLGPDAEPIARREDYTVDPARRSAFFAGAVRFLPFLQEEDLSPDMAGIRPRLVLQGFADFQIRRETGPLAGLIDLIGIDSPGLTAAPAIGELVGGWLAERP